MSVLILSPNGTYSNPSLTLAQAAVSPQLVGKTIVVTSPQVVTTAIAWPDDRELKFDKGGYVTFTGIGALTGLKEARPEWFNTTGTNDHAGTQSAIAAAAKVIADGTYYFGAGVTIPSNKEITGKGTFYRKTGSGVYDMFANADTVGGNVNIKISAITVDGNKDADSLVATDAADRFSGIKFTNVSGDSYVKNCTIKNTVNNETGAGIYLDTCMDMLIENNTITGNDRTGIIYFDGARCSFVNNRAYSNTGSGISGGGCTDAVFINNKTYSNGSGGNYSGLNVSSNRARVIGNLSYSNTGTGIAVGEVAHAADDAQLTGNISYSNTYEGVTIQNASRVRIVGGEVHSNARNNIRIISGTNCSIIGATVRDSAGGSGIYLDDGAYHIVNGCTICGNYGSGIAIDSTSDDNNISNNIIYNNGAGVSVNSAGILVNTSDNNTIAQNRIFDTLGASGTQESGIWMAAGSGNLVSSNMLYTNKTNSIKETSSPLYTRVKNKTGADALSGSFTATGGVASTTVNNNNVTTGARVKVWPMTTGSWAKKVAVSSVVAGTSFTVSTADGNFVGTETYVYEIE